MVRAGTSRSRQDYRCGVKARERARIHNPRYRATEKGREAGRRSLAKQIRLQVGGVRLYYGGFDPEKTKELKELLAAKKAQQADDYKEETNGW